MAFHETTKPIDKNAAILFLRTLFRSCLKTKKHKFIQNIKKIAIITISNPDLPYFLAFKSLVRTFKNFEFNKAKNMRYYFNLLSMLYLAKSFSLKAEERKINEFFIPLVSIAKSKKFSKFDKIICEFLEADTLTKISGELSDRIDFYGYAGLMMKNQISEDLLNAFFDSERDTDYLLLLFLKNTSNSAFLERVFSFLMRKNCLDLMHYGLRLLTKRGIPLGSLLTPGIDNYLALNVTKLNSFQRFYIHNFFSNSELLKNCIYYTCFTSDIKMCKSIAKDILSLLDPCELESWLVELKKHHFHNGVVNFTTCLFSVIKKDARSVLSYYKGCVFGKEGTPKKKLINFFLIDDHCKFSNINVSFSLVASFFSELFAFLFPNIKKSFFRWLISSKLAKSIIVIASQKDSLIQKMAYVYLNFIATNIDSKMLKLFFKYAENPKTFPCILRTPLLETEPDIVLPKNGADNLDDDSMLKMDEFFSKLFSTKGDILRQISERIGKCIMITMRLRKEFDEDLAIAFVKYGLKTQKFDHHKILRFVIDSINQGHDCSKVIALIERRDFLRDIIVSSKYNPPTFKRLAQVLDVCLNNHKDSRFLPELLELSYKKNSINFLLLLDNTDFKDLFLKYLASSRIFLLRKILSALEKYLLRMFHTFDSLREKICTLFDDILLCSDKIFLSEKTVDKILESLNRTSKESIYNQFYAGCQ